MNAQYVLLHAGLAREHVSAQAAGEAVTARMSDEVGLQCHSLDEIFRAVRTLVSAYASVRGNVPVERTLQGKPGGAVGADERFFL